MTPSSDAELADFIRTTSTPLWIGGGNTRGVSGQGSAVSTRLLRGVVLYEPEALTLVVGAGTPVAEVEALLAKEGQRLAFEPSDPRILTGATGEPTIGGMVAMNCSGPRKVQVGSCRDFLIGARFVDGAGRIVKSGGRVMKNVTGYDLARMMCGARGQLGVLTEVALKVLPKPEAQMTLRLKATLRDAPKIMAKALGTPWEVSGAAWLKGDIWLRIEGFQDQITYRSARLADALVSIGAVDMVADANWNEVRDAALLAKMDGDLWRITCRPSEAAHITAGLDPTMTLLDHGGATIMTRVPPGTDLREHGHAECLVGPFPALPHLAEAVSAIQTGLKAKFDPRNILNRAV